MRSESAFERMQTVRVTNCCWQTVPHDWPGGPATEKALSPNVVPACATEQQWHYRLYCWQPIQYNTV